MENSQTKGRDYFNWFIGNHKDKWLNNFYKQIDDCVDADVALNLFMKREFPHYFVFFFLSFDINKSKEGTEYWLNLFHEYKKYDNINVKPGFGPFGLLKSPNIFNK